MIFIQILDKFLAKRYQKSIPDDNSCEANHLAVQFVSLLDDIQYFAFLAFVRGRDEGEGFMFVGVEIGIHGHNFL